MATTRDAQFRQPEHEGIALPGRAHGSELLERGHGSQADVEANFAEMWRLNRIFGGLAALTRHLYPRLLEHRGQVTLLDLGCGAADIPAAIVRWARHRDVDLRVLAVDRSPRALTIARERTAPYPEITLLHADAHHLPLPPGGVDYVVSSLLLHHFPPTGAAALLTNAYRHARCGVIMSDLVRGWLPLAAFKLIQPLFARSFMTRHDGALSIQRAYTPAELAKVAAQAGLTGARVHTHFAWRMTLVANR